jgi:hypothetical protein
LPASQAVRRNDKDNRGERSCDEALKLFLQNLLDSSAIAIMSGFGRCLVGSNGLIERLSLSVAPACRHLGF